MTRKQGQSTFDNFPSEPWGTSSRGFAFVKRTVKNAGIKAVQAKWYTDQLPVKRENIKHDSLIRLISTEEIGKWL